MAKLHYKDYQGDYVLVGIKIYHADEIHDLFIKVGSEEEDIAFQKKFENMYAMSYKDKKFIKGDELIFDHQDTEYLYNLKRLNEEDMLNAKI